jgi:hypothetical protein
VLLRRCWPCLSDLSHLLQPSTEAQPICSMLAIDVGTVVLRDGWAEFGGVHAIGHRRRLSGTDRVQDAAVMLHEAHHGALNESAAWGTALHVANRSVLAIVGVSLVFGCGPLDA